MDRGSPQSLHTVRQRLAAVPKLPHFLQRQRLQSELEQRRLAARLGLLMRHANDVIMILDERMHVVDVNDRVAKGQVLAEIDKIRWELRDPAQ